MLKNYFTTKLLAIFCLFFTSLGFSQTQDQIKKITRDYNLEGLEALKTKNEKDFFADYNETLRLANRNGWPIRYKEGNTLYSIKEVIKGRPIYWSTDNSTDQATSTRTNFLHSTGSLGLNLEGQDMTVYLWEVDGIALATHREYDGPGGDDRFSVGDDQTAVDDHAAHVTGTIISSGISPNAKGMAPQAKAIGFNVINALAEATAAAANGMLVSNHSYGVPTDSYENDLSFLIGAYTEQARSWDELMFNAPYYLPVFSAGNSGNDNTSNITPLGGDSNFDKLTTDKVAKNNLVVASSEAAVINADGSLSSVVRSPFSSEGPTDDYRIKPDIMGHGSAVTSTGSRFPFTYVTLQGTSMSAPNVSGSLILLQQHYNNINNNYMRAATLKGLALHTADDTELVGPDATTGWGLLNAKKAVETISENGFSSYISEEVLNNGESFTLEVVSDGLSPLLASISWTDRPGEALQITNPTPSNIDTPVLVNDLDIRVTQTSSTFTPWKLTGINTNTQGDNIVDPYERVDVAGAAGTYTITVTHKGSLVGGSQNFSLIVTGLSSNFTLNTQESVQNICSNNDATYSFNYLETGGGTTNFSLTNVPANATSSITPSSLNADGSFEVTIGNLANVSANTYNINVIGDDGNETETRIIKLRVLHPDFTPYPQSLSLPGNGQGSLPSSVSLEWQENLNAESYLVEVSTNPGFSSILFSNTQSSTQYNISGLTSETTYYWRVRPENQCNIGNYSQTYSFQVGEINCGTNIFTATDFSDANILTTPGVTASVPVTVSTGGLSLDSVEVSFEINHTYVNDLIISLESPASNGNAKILLFDQSCNIDNGGDGTNPGDGDNFVVTYSDSGADLFCDDPVVPTISGTFKPVESLSGFTGISADGVWTLRIEDPNNQDGGDIIAFSLNFCVVNTLAVDEFKLGDISIWPNPAKNTLNFKLTNIESNDDVKVNIYDMHGRTIKNFNYDTNTNYLSESIELSNIQNGIYLLEIKQGNKKDTRKIIVNK